MIRPIKNESGEYNYRIGQFLNYEQRWEIESDPERVIPMLEKKINAMRVGTFLLVSLIRSILYFLLMPRPPLTEELLSGQRARADARDGPPAQRHCSVLREPLPDESTDHCPTQCAHRRFDQKIFALTAERISERNRDAQLNLDRVLTVCLLLCCRP